ncbi:hypothetical protein Gotur_007014, partial [Gossypium turneri]
HLRQNPDVCHIEFCDPEKIRERNGLKYRFCSIMQMQINQKWQMQIHKKLTGGRGTKNLRKRNKGKKLDISGKEPEGRTVFGGEKWKLPAKSTFG